MTDLETHIKVVNNKLQDLVKNYGLLQKENLHLSEQVSGLLQKEKDNKEIIYALNQKVTILQAASGQMNEQEQKEFEKRVNLYLKEIDKCISMLSE